MGLGGDKIYMQSPSTHMNPEAPKCSCDLLSKRSSLQGGKTGNRKLYGCQSSNQLNDYICIEWHADFTYYTVLAWPEQC